MFWGRMKRGGKPDNFLVKGIDFSTSVKDNASTPTTKCGFTWIKTYKYKYIQLTKHLHSYRKHTSMHFTYIRNI